MCRTFSLPEIQRSDLFAAAAKAANGMDVGATSGNSGDNCEAWSDEYLLGLFEELPDELSMDVDFASNTSDESSVGQHSLSDDSLSTTSNSYGPVVQQIQLPTYEFGFNMGLHAREEGFIALPCSKSFAHVNMKSIEAIREEKLNVIDPFIGSMNESDLFSLFSICQTMCDSNVQFYSNSCQFNYAGPLSLMVFWTLLFEEHYQARIQCLSRRLNSTLKPLSRGCSVPDSSMFESVDFVLKLDGARLTEFRRFELFTAVMNSGYIHDNMSLPEILNVADAFVKDYHNSMTPSHQMFQMTYLFEINIKFHAIHQTISSWHFELLGVQLNH
mmetsp:Transcript_39684/g.29305  ORF Transcript_39684/g.29305 Transcript_39684/m.29305 type:complete len:329 (-) Transcript_39684:453-1439(-)|eukprot:CAMPEP_0202964260 /NCGR_PEP_ID=MMETSP1396-20130829/8330_1 /ASSEMBLY_ACC=CAM_ASM_000872 /TAXON_ID= /ORGANISM="Pseudokeronopsis sp., Strain Brazil" /LENGTH=328 /DNA_ID=CAMNT_0049686229 /DNA_START=82 /DNA_END=1068 /DNA_ORIENTATION=+